MCDAQHPPGPCWGLSSPRVPPCPSPQSCWHPKLTYQTAGWPCLPEITLRAKQRTQGQSEEATLGHSQTPNYTNNPLGPPTTPPHFLARETETQRGKGISPRSPGESVASLFLSPASLCRIPAPTSALAQHAKITNSFIQQSLAGCLYTLCTQRGASR